MTTPVFEFEAWHPITKDKLTERNWRDCLLYELERIGLARTTRGFKLVEDPEWVDRCSNNPSHGCDYYRVQVTGPEAKIKALIAAQDDDEIENAIG